jgi:hypothetical protein
MVTPLTPARLAVIRDISEEGWAGVNLCAEMLPTHFLDGAMRAAPVGSRFRRLFGRVPGVPRLGLALKTDRPLNAFLGLPRPPARPEG